MREKIAGARSRPEARRRHPERTALVGGLLVSKVPTSVTLESRTDKSIAVWESAVAFFHATIPEPIHVKLGKDLCPPKHVWRLRRAMNGDEKPSETWCGRISVSTPRRQQDRAHGVQL